MIILFDTTYYLCINNHSKIVKGFLIECNVSNKKIYVSNKRIRKNSLINNLIL